MNTLNIMGVRACINSILGLVLILIPFTSLAWDVDFSRRSGDIERTRSAGETPQRGLASIYEEQAPLVSEPGAGSQISGAQSGAYLKGLFEASGPTQDIVVLNTDKGFVPKTLRVFKGGHYQVKVVNINDEQKNLSFILDAFSEHHGTYYGKLKTFSITPKEEGVFSFHCPETGAAGEIVVTETARALASE